jgi:RNA polymerase sigma-70 factor, ECF subfamily
MDGRDLATTTPAPAVDDDETLVRRTLMGDLAAFETLVERHRDVVFRVARRMVGEHDAEDVAQDALLRAFHKLSTFRGDAPFRPWLLRIVHNTALNARARRRPVPVAEVPEPGPGDAAAAGRAKTPADSLEEAERRARMAQKLELLRPAHRAVIVLRDLEGLSYEEIAEATDAPLGSVKGRLHRARLELIELLRNNTYDWELP